MPLNLCKFKVLIAPSVNLSLRPFLKSRNFHETNLRIQQPSGRIGGCVTSCCCQSSLAVPQSHMAEPERISWGWCDFWCFNGKLWTLIHVFFSNIENSTWIPMWRVSRQMLIQVLFSIVIERCCRTSLISYSVSSIILIRILWVKT